MASPPSASFHSGARSSKSGLCWHLEDLVDEDDLHDLQDLGRLLYFMMTMQLSHQPPTLRVAFPADAL